MAANPKHSKRENSDQQCEILKRIGTKIRNERNRLGLSLEALARKVGISKMTLHRIETGMTTPSVITLTEISFHLKKPVESLRGAYFVSKPSRNTFHAIRLGGYKFLNNLKSYNCL